MNRRYINPEEAKKAYNDALQKIQDTWHPVFIPGSPFVSIEARSHVNTKPEIPHVDIPQKEQYAFDKEKSAEEKLGEAIESEIIAFGKKHGFPAIYVITEKDVLPMTVIGGKVVRGGKLNLFTTSDMRQAERIAKKYNGTIGVYKDPSEYNDSMERRKMDGNDCIKHVIPSSICAPGYESGLAARQKEEQEKCPYCDEEMLDNEIGGEPIPEFGKGYAIEQGDIKAFIEKKYGKYYLSHNFTPNSSDFFFKMEIKFCPMCNRKL